MFTYCILGTGAVGGYYGALLQRAGQEVHFLLRSDYEHVKQNGLRVDSINGNFVLEKMKVYPDAESMPKCDVAVVAWKTTDNNHLPAILPRALKPRGIVLVLQNGFDPERDSAACAPEAQVLGGLCFLGSRKAGPGWIMHQAYGSITFAAYPNSQGAGPMAMDRLRQVEMDFNQAGVETRWQENWHLARWSKLVWNIPFNGLCTVLGQNTFQLLQQESNRSLIKELMVEVVEGARACGVFLPEDIVNRMLVSTEKMAPYEPSMKLDYDSARPLEWEAIYYRTLVEIKKAGGKAPRMESLLVQLKNLERNYQVKARAK
jgi:2-dehydropantoate 2-reductase